MYFEIKWYTETEIFEYALWKQRGKNKNIFFNFLNISIETKAL